MGGKVAEPSAWNKVMAVDFLQERRRDLVMYGSAESPPHSTSTVLLFSTAAAPLNGKRRAWLESATAAQWMAFT